MGRMFCFRILPEIGSRLDLSSNEKRPGCGADAVRHNDGSSHKLHWRGTGTIRSTGGSCCKSPRRTAEGATLASFGTRTHTQHSMPILPTGWRLIINLKHRQSHLPSHYVDVCRHCILASSRVKWQ